MKNIHGRVCRVIIFFIFLLFVDTAISKEGLNILKIASYEQLVLIKIENEIKTITVGDLLDDYGILSEILNHRLVFKKTSDTQVETIIIDYIDGNQTVSHITRKIKPKPVQIPVQEGNP